MSRRVFAALGLLFALSPSGARAQPARSEPGNPTPPAAICDRESTAIGRSACLVSTSLAGVADSALVVAAPAVGDERVSVPRRVTERLAQLVAARLGVAARPTAEPLALAEAQRRAGSARGLIYLSVALYRDRLELTADAYTGSGHFWQRVRAPGLRLNSHAFTSSPLDAELRALFPAIPLVVTRVDKATGSERDILAIACGDVRGDGSREIAAVGRRKVQVGRLEHGRFSARATLNWADFSAVAQSPLREPIATCTLPAPGRLWVGLSDRADALDLSGALKVEHKWHGVMPWPGGGCTRRAGLGYAGQAQACPGTAASVVIDFGAPLDAFSSRLLSDHEGQARTLRVARPVGSDAARVLDSLHAEVSVPNVGAQLAVGDLDEDGLPEIVTSSPSLDRRADQLVVRTLTDNGQLRERLRIPVPTGIDALAICPGDGRAMAPLAVATGDGIWVIR
ncbi:MAG: hypothetical protein ABIQ16_24350 [Polyangiaceae bacterium]